MSNINWLYMGKRGKAGNHGGRIRSDCLVEVELQSSGGISLDLDSKVDALYGRSIRVLVLKMMDHFGVSHAKLNIRDSGALEFVLAARIEAAVRQVSESIPEFLPPGSGEGGTRGTDNRERFRFTRLYLPGNSPSMMLNAGIHKPDGIILDLEDSVALSVKPEARALVRNALRVVDFYGAERMVRINQLPEGLKDLDAIASAWPELILIPKVESAAEIQEVEHEILRLSGGNAGGVLFMPILESALGIENAFEIARASRKVVAMAIGLEDYTADMGVQRTEEGAESLFARSRMVNACRAAGIQAIDSVYSDVDNEKGLRETVKRSKSMGFEGMGCIHPRQIPVIKDAFKPGHEEIKRARDIVLAFEDAESKGLGVVSLGSKMIDAPVVKRARRTIDLALNFNLISQKWREEDEEE
jgi:citrate lyase subunit beta/citryl-CoA lyase